MAVEWPKQTAVKFTNMAIRICLFVDQAVVHNHSLRLHVDEFH